MSYNQCYHKVYQSISISEIKRRVYPLIAFSSLTDINTILKIGITITWSFTLRYVIATTSLWCWKKISYNDVTSISKRSRSISRCKPNKKPMSPQYRVPTGDRTKNQIAQTVFLIPAMAEEALEALPLLIYPFTLNKIQCVLQKFKNFIVITYYWKYYHYYMYYCIFECKYVLALSCRVANAKESRLYERV